MPVKTEYSRTYRQPSPSSPCPHVPAGKSSAKMATTLEPAIGRKKKAHHTESNVGFITGIGEENKQPEQDHSGFRFKAGFRRPPKIPLTAYQRDFPWPETTPANTPLLNAQNTLHKSSHNNQTKPKHTAVQKQPSPVLHCEQCAQKTQSKAPLPEPLKEPQLKDHGAKSKTSPKKAEKTRSRQAKQRQIIQELMAQQPRGSGKRSSGTKQKKKFRQFVTEYQREFGKGSVKSSRKSKSGSFVAGMPRILTDITDPRLLKHSPLPLDAPTTAHSWVTDNMANFVSPVESDYLNANIRSSSERHNTEPLTNVSPIAGDVDHEQDEEDPLVPVSSWYNQLRDIRERAQRYKKRSEGVNIRRLLPLTKQDLKEHSNSNTPTLSECTSTSISSPSPSDSASCVYPNCPHHSPQHQASTGPHSSAHVSTEPVVSRAINKDRSLEQQMAPSVRTGPQALAVYDVEDSDSGDEHHKGCAPTVCKGVPVSTEPIAEEPGRVQTPTLQKSSSDFRRHHLDLTTPMGGGLFISPKKKPEPKLPYPPVSPKFRRDMRSSAPISPAPKARSSERVVVDADSQSSGSIELDSPVDEPLVSQPASSSPYHANCAPVQSTSPVPAQRVSIPVHKTSSVPMREASPTPAQRSSFVPAQRTSSIPAQRITSVPVQTTAPVAVQKPSSILVQRPSAPRSSTLPAQSSVRKLDFKSSLKSKSTTSKPAASESYSYRVQGLENSEDNCQICGAHLQPSVDHSSLQYSRPTSQTRAYGLSSSLSRDKNPSVTITGTGQHSSIRRPDPGPSYMTRLSSQVESKERDFDESSLASLSLSSCSIASDVLKKARNRRDNFWAQPKHVTAS